MGAAELLVVSQFSPRHSSSARFRGTPAKPLTTNVYFVFKVSLTEFCQNDLSKGRELETG